MRKYYKVEKGEKFALERRKQVADITKDMLDSGETITLKPYISLSSLTLSYNFCALGKEPDSGYLHPLLLVRAEFRKILLEMGFQEMPTSQFVESSFWNFDALFQPQSHPARDAQDTFFISDPATTVSVPEEYVPVVEQIHSEGGYGSFG